MTDEETKEKVVANHSGHRERLRARAKLGGFESLSDYEKLEMLLFSFIPRKNTNGIAHILIDTCGSLYNVFNAEEEVLRQVPNMTERAVKGLKSLADFAKMYEDSKTIPDEYILNFHCLANVVKEKLQQQKGFFVCIALNFRRMVIKSMVFAEDNMPTKAELVKNFSIDRCNYLLLGFADERALNYTDFINDINRAFATIDIKIDDVCYLFVGGAVSFRKIGKLTDIEFPTSALVADNNLWKKLI